MQGRLIHSAENLCGDSSLRRALSGAVAKQTNRVDRLQLATKPRSCEPNSARKVPNPVQSLTHPA